MKRNISTEGPTPITPESMSEAIGTMSDPKTRDLKKETGVHTPGSETKDRVAYKQCVAQQKQQQSTNPWAMCNAQFGIGKSENVPVGSTYGKLQKKESNKIKTNHSDAGKIKEAQKEHMKPTHPQTPKIKVPNLKIKQPTFKSELEPRMSWNQLQKMQTEQPLAKDDAPSWANTDRHGNLRDGTKFHLHANHPDNSHLTPAHHKELATHHASIARGHSEVARTGKHFGSSVPWNRMKYHRQARDFHQAQAQIHHEKSKV